MHIYSHILYRVSNEVFWLGFQLHAAVLQVAILSPPGRNMRLLNNSLLLETLKLFSLLILMKTPEQYNNKWFWADIKPIFLLHIVHSVYIVWIHNWNPLHSRFEFLLPRFEQWFVYSTNRGCFSTQGMSGRNARQGLRTCRICAVRQIAQLSP
jgi:hypothetical protein